MLSALMQPVKLPFQVPQYSQFVSREVRPLVLDQSREQVRSSDVRIVSEQDANPAAFAASSPAATDLPDPAGVRNHIAVAQHDLDLHSPYVSIGDMLVGDYLLKLAVKDKLAPHPCLSYLLV